MLNEGELAPDFELPADDGSRVRLSDFRGRKVILYFYPRADTPGCTVEACEFRDVYPQIEAEGAVVLGVSPDPLEAVKSFRDKFDLPFRLLADQDHTVAELYQVWKEKSMYGNTYMGVARTTFLLDEERRIQKVYHEVNPEGHAGEILGGLGGRN